MRIFTYAALVLRRMWAKRGVLLGSLLGTTLVISLLVIVPLYEASIAAVDLVFTFRQAPAVEVDLRATVDTTAYDGPAAAATRTAFNDAVRDVEPWYPIVVERTLTREFQIIPPGPPDWFGQADRWRADAAEWIDEVGEILGAPVGDRGRNPQEVNAAIDVGEIAAALPPGGEVPEFPAPPYPRPPIEATVTRFLTGPDVADRVRITNGQWPDAQPDPADPLLQVAFGEELARRTGLGIGDRTIVKPFIALPETFEVVEVAAIVAAVDPTDPVWLGVSAADLILLPQDGFDAWFTAIPLGDPSADPWLRTQRGFPAINATQSWYLPNDRDSVQLENVADLRSAAAGFAADLGRVSGVAVRTALPSLLESFDVRKVVFGGPILAMLALVVAGALYFLVYTSSLNLEREAPELALLRTRGASRWQTVGIHLLQSAFIAVAASAAAPFVARFMVAITGRIPPMSELTGGDPLRVAQEDSLLPFIAAGAIITFVTMGLAVIPFARRTVLELRTLAARPARTSVWQRYYIDVFVVVLAAILLFELRREGLVDPGSTELGLDPFAVASPALFLLAGALVLLRLLPVMLRGLGWLMTRLPGMGSALPGWHLGRNPIPYGRLALLIWLTTGFGAFALTYAQTLDTSYDDRAAFAAGADVRLVAAEAGFLEAPDGATATGVYRSQGAPRLASRGAELLAVRPDEFSRVTAWRSDFGAETAGDLFSRLRPDGPPALGVPLPAGTQALVVDALAVRTGDPEVGGIPLQIVARVVDGVGRTWTFASGPLGQGAWTTAEISLDAADALNDGPATVPEPLTLTTLWAERPVAGTASVLVGEQLLLDGWRARSSAGDTDLTVAIGTTFTGHDGLSVDTVPGDHEPSRAREGELQRWILPVRGRLSPVPHLRLDPEPIPVLLDATAAGQARIDVGDEAQYGISSEIVSGVRVGTIDLLPSAGDPTTTGLMVTDLDALLAWLNAQPTWSLGGTLSRLETPGELWVATNDPDGAVRVLTAQLVEEPELVITTRGAAAEFSSRPVQVGLVSILFLGAATGVVLALAGVTGYVLLAVRRRTREMGVLRALGFGRRGVAATFAVEQLVVLVLGALIGVVAGVLLMRLLLPFLQLGETATELLPPAVLILDPGILGAYLAVVALLLVASVLWATRSVSARRLSEVLREGDR